MDDPRPQRKEGEVKPFRVNRPRFGPASEEAGRSRRSPNRRAYSRGQPTKRSGLGNWTSSPALAPGADPKNGPYPAAPIPPSGEREAKKDLLSGSGGSTAMKRRGVLGVTFIVASRPLPHPKLLRQTLHGELMNGETPVVRTGPGIRTVPGGPRLCQRRRRPGLLLSTKFRLWLGAHRTVPVPTSTAVGLPLASFAHLSPLGAKCSLQGTPVPLSKPPPPRPGARSSPVGR